MQFDNICAALVSLTPDQLREIKARCVMLLSGAPTAANEVPSDIAEQALGMLTSWARARGFDQSSYVMLRKLPEYPTFAYKAKIVMGELINSCNNRAELTSMARAGFQLLYDDCCERGPCTVRTLMRQFHRLPSVIDAGFPGYRQIGLLRLLISGKMESKQGREIYDARKK